MTKWYIPTLTIDETVKRMREAGMKISRDKLIAGIYQGVYPFADMTKLTNLEYTVYEKMFNEWCEARGYKIDEETGEPVNGYPYYPVSGKEK